MAVLITGGTGFVGLATAEAFGQMGHESLLFADQPAPRAYRSAPGLSKTKYFEGDIRSPIDLANAMKSVEISHVVHLAAVTPSPMREQHDPWRISDVNVGGTATLMSVLRDFEPKGRVLIVSSVAVYGYALEEGHFDEVDSIPAPVSLYGISKLAAEQTAIRLGVLYGLEARVIRLGPVFGPWEYRTAARDLMSPHRQIMDALKAGEEIILPRALRADWLYSRDAGRGIASVLFAADLRSRVLNLGGHERTDLIQWCDRLAKEHPGLRWRLCGDDETPTILTPLEQDRAILNCMRIKSETGFHHAFDQALAAQDYVGWLNDYEADTPGKPHE